jgi:hypothetical protein
MKTMALLLSAVLTALWAGGPRPAAVVEWLSSTTHDFGEIPQGIPVRHTFHFRNRGEAPLIIDNVRPSCGCTTPEWPDSPVPVDSTASITVEFNANMPGYFNKLVKVYYRGRRGADRLYLSGWVGEGG